MVFQNRKHPKSTKITRSKHHKGPSNTLGNIPFIPRRCRILDVYHRFMNPNLKQRQLLWSLRRRSFTDFEDFTTVAPIQPPPQVRRLSENNMATCDPEYFCIFQSKDPNSRRQITWGLERTDISTSLLSWELKGKNPCSRWLTKNKVTPTKETIAQKNYPPTINSTAPNMLFVEHKGNEILRFDHFIKTCLMFERFCESLGPLDKAPGFTPETDVMVAGMKRDCKQDKENLCSILKQGGYYEPVFDYIASQASQSSTHVNDGLQWFIQRKNILREEAESLGLMQRLTTLFDYMEQEDYAWWFRDEIKRVISQFK